MKRIVKLSDIRKLNKQVSLGEITAMQMVEIINVKAYEQACKAIESFKEKQAKFFIELNYDRKPIAFEWHNELTGHATVDYDNEYRKDLVISGYTKKPLFY